jgi:hypothetical protein
MEVCSRCGIYQAIDQGLCERCLEDLEAMEEELTDQEKDSFL